MAHSDTVILINRNGMGHAEQALQQRLISTYLQLLNFPLQSVFIPKGYAWWWRDLPS